MKSDPCPGVFCLFYNRVLGFLLLPSAFVCAAITPELGALVCMPSQYKKLEAGEKSAFLALVELFQVRFGVRRG